MAGAADLQGMRIGGIVRRGGGRWSRRRREISPRNKRASLFASRPLLHLHSRGLLLAVRLASPTRMLSRSRRHVAPAAVAARSPVRVALVDRCRRAHAWFGSATTRVPSRTTTAPLEPNLNRQPRRWNGRPDMTPGHKPLPGHAPGEGGRGTRVRQEGARHRMGPQGPSVNSGVWLLNLKRSKT